MERKKILIVDDEQDLCDILEYNLVSAGYEVATAYSAEDALQTNLASFNLLLLDVMMSGMNGFDLAKKCKSSPTTSRIPIIFLTAKDDEESKLEGFSYGADDYICKPFSLREVLARVNAVLNRSIAEMRKSDITEYDGLVMNMVKKEVYLDGKQVPFTRTEFYLLWYLLSHPGHVFDRDELISNAWPADVVVTGRTVDVNITRIRKKIGRHASSIKTKQGFGYGFCP